MPSRKKKKRTLQRDVGSFVGAGVTLGVGTAVVAKAGGASAGVMPAFRTTGRMMGSVGMAMMGRQALRILGKYPKQKRRRGGKK